MEENKNFYIEKLEIPPENLEPRQYAETLRMAINEIIEYLKNKRTK